MSSVTTRFKHALLLILGLAAAASAAGVEPERQGELLHLLKQDCGSCHGMTMKGGLGPALTPAALATQPDEALFATILNGRPGTPMPPWRGLLEEDEIAWLVARLREGLPDETP
jgi:cytochrome c55X